MLQYYQQMLVLSQLLFLLLILEAQVLAVTHPQTQVQTLIITRQTLQTIMEDRKLLLLQLQVLLLRLLITVAHLLEVLITSLLLSSLELLLLLLSLELLSVLFSTKDARNRLYRLIDRLELLVKITTVKLLLQLVLMNFSIIQRLRLELFSELLNRLTSKIMQMM